MNRKKALLTTAALGAAYLLRNKEAREKIMSQFKALSGPSKRKTESAH